MSRKKIITVCVSVFVAVSAIISIFVLRNSNADELKTPIPTAVETASSSLFPSSMSDVAIKKDALSPVGEEKTVDLFSKTYKLRSYASDKTFITSNGVTTSEHKINEYYDTKNGTLTYTVVIDKEISATYDKNGTVVRILSNYSPKTDYETESITWYFKDGTLSCGEMSFYDVNGNFGTAYYDKDGKLSCVVTETYPVEDGEASIVSTYFNSAFEKVEKEEFMSLVPETDTDSFLYINW